MNQITLKIVDNHIEYAGTRIEVKRFEYSPPRRTTHFTMSETKKSLAYIGKRVHLCSDSCDIFVDGRDGLHGMISECYKMSPSICDAQYGYLNMFIVIDTDIGKVLYMDCFHPEPGPHQANENGEIEFFGDCSISDNVFDTTKTKYDLEIESPSFLEADQALQQKQKDDIEKNHLAMKENCKEGYDEWMKLRNTIPGITTENSYDLFVDLKRGSYENDLFSQGFTYEVHVIMNEQYADGREYLWNGIEWKELIVTKRGTVYTTVDSKGKRERLRYER